MPVHFVTTGPEHAVPVRSCDGCGSPHAPWGTGSLHEAIRTKDPSKVKCWCGENGCVAQDDAKHGAGNIAGMD